MELGRLIDDLGYFHFSGAGFTITDILSKNFLFSFFEISITDLIWRPFLSVYTVAELKGIF